MQPIDKKLIKSLIKEAKEAGKDVSKLEAAIEPVMGARAEKLKPKQGEKKKVKETERGTIIIESTGPAKEEDFK
jgi:hypothetical protein